MQKTKNAFLQKKNAKTQNWSLVNLIQWSGPYTTLKIFSWLSLTTLISAQPSSAAVLHQSFATVAPPVTAQTTAAPHQEPGRPEKGTYMVRGSNGTACLLASMGLQLDVTYVTVQNKVRRKQKLETDVRVRCTWVGLKSLSFLWPAQTLQQVVNIQPNVTNSNGSCDADSATLRLTSTDKTILTFVFTLVRFVTAPLPVHHGLLSIWVAVYRQTHDLYFHCAVSLNNC